MNIRQHRRKTGIILLLLFICTFSFEISKCQTTGVYPPYTKWYQDPLGLRPLELSSAFGFVWGTASIAACLILTKNDSGFQKGLSIYQETGYSFAYKPPYTNTLQNEAGLIYEVRKWMALGFGLNSFHFKDKINDTWSFGTRPFVRWYPYKTKKASLFCEYGAGFSYSLDKFPLTGTGWEADTARVGTRFNLTSKYGIGAEVHFNKNLSLQAGARHFHLSNGNLAGIQRNPSYDGNGFFVGLLYSGKGKTAAR